MFHNKKTSKKDLLIDLNLINNNEEEEKIKENSLFDEVFNADYLMRWARNYRYIPNNIKQLKLI